MNRGAYLLAFCAVIAAAPLALADATPPDSARKHFEEGKRLYRDGKREQACAEFRQAYTEFASKNVLWNLIVCEGATKKTLEQMRHLRQYLKLAGQPAEGTPEWRELHEQWDAAFANTGHVEIDAPPGTDITIGDDPVSQRAPLAGPIDVDVGMVRIVGRLGDETNRKEVVAIAGKNVQTKLTFANSSATATTAVTSGDPATPTPVPDRPTEHPTRSPVRYIVPLAIAGAGLASVVAGIAFGAASNGAADKADSIRQSHPSSACTATPAPSFCADAADATDTQNRDATLSKVFIGTGAVLIAGGAALFFLWPEQKLQPTVGRGFAGMNFVHQF